MIRDTYIRSKRFFKGPNIYSSSSGLFAMVSCRQKEIPIFQKVFSPHALANLLDIIQEAFPVAQESSALSSPDSFFRSANPAVELLLEICEILLRDFSVRSQKGRIISSEKEYFTCIIPCEEAELGLVALELALMVVQEQYSLSGHSRTKLVQKMQQRYLEIRKQLRSWGLNQSTLALTRAAEKRGIYYHRLSKPGQYVQLGQGVHLIRIKETASDKTSPIGYMLSDDKYKTVVFLKSIGLPTADSIAIFSIDQAKIALKQLGFPLVVKPRILGKGKGVILDIRDEQSLLKAIKDVSAKKGGILIERYIKGNDHRLLVVAGKFIAAAKRTPAAVIGDGISSVKQLIDRINRDPRRGMKFERILEKIEIDEEARKCLAKEKLSLDSVLQKGREVMLRGTANISRGGISVDVTDDIHPENRSMAERAARMIGLDVVGIDFFTEDIGRSWRETDCAILEVNSSPGLRPHQVANPEHDITAPIIEHYFPEGCNGRIPTVGVTGSLGKTTTCQMVSHILSTTGKCVALSTTQGSWIGNEGIHKGDVAGGMSGALLMRDPCVEAGVFELSRGGLIKAGMVIDSIDVGVVLNVHDNHVGLDGIETREDLARAKSLVVRHTRKMAILNADDPLCLGMRDVVSAPKICLVSSRPDNDEVLLHRSEGGTVVYLDAPHDVWEKGNIQLCEGERLIGTIPVESIVSTLGGRYRPALFNALFSTATAHGLGIGFETILRSVSSFESTRESNSGRMNLVDGAPFLLYVTWADGPVANAEIADFARKTEVSGKKILMASATGNRPDRFIQESGLTVADAFDLFICYDMQDRRGRREGETPELLREGLKEAGVAEERIMIIPPLNEAVNETMSRAAKDDLVVITAFGNTIWPCIDAFKATPD